MSSLVKLGSVATPEGRDTEGVWMDSTYLPGVRFKVRPLDTKPYLAELAKRTETLFRRSGKVRPPEDDLFRLRGELFADFILLDWSGFDEAYSKTRAVELLTDRRYRKFVDDIQALATTAADPEIEFVEDAIKN